jgi:hypothetical protein
VIRPLRSVAFEFDTRNDAKVGRQLALVRKVADMADDRKQDTAVEPADPLDAGEILMPFQLWPSMVSSSSAMLLFRLRI